MCKVAALAKELRDLSLCSAIPIPGYYKNNRKKYGMRKSRTYKGKPHNSHVKPFKRKYKDDRGRVKKCKCFICGKEGHFEKYCRSKQGNIARSGVYQELDIDDNWDIVSADFDDNSVYSISEGEGDTHQSISVIVQDASLKKQPSWNYLCKIVNVKRNQPQKPEEEKDFSSNEVRLLKELLKEKTEQSEKSHLVRDLTDALKIIDQLKAEQIRLEEQKDEEIRKLKAQLQEKKEEEIEVKFSKEEFPPLGKSQTARPFIEAEVHYSGNTTAVPKVRKITN
ncbi:Orf y [Tanacetum coccineum]